MCINQFDKSFILGQSAQKQKGVTQALLVFYFLRLFVVFLWKNNNLGET